MRAPRSFGLVPLLGSLNARRFLHAFWPERCFVAHGGRSRFLELSTIRNLSSSRAFLHAWNRDAYSWPPEAGNDRVARVSKARLRRAYESGCTIYCVEVEKKLPELSTHIESLKRDLGLHRAEMTCQVVLSKAGYGGQPHFDADCTFNLQLQGEKRWRVAPNRSVSRPHLSRMMVDPVLPEMAAYARRTFPERMPKDAERFTTRAGSVVYLPHGCWHSTRCTADSLALLFVLTGPKWYELFLREIESELIRSPEARKISLVGSRRDVVRARRVLERLRAIVSSMDAAALVRRWRDTPRVRFRKLDASRSPLISARPLAKTLKWLGKAAPTFTAADALNAFPERSASAVLRDLTVLVRLKVLEVAPPAH